MPLRGFDPHPREAGDIAKVEGVAAERVSIRTRVKRVTVVAILFQFVDRVSIRTRVKRVTTTAATRITQVIRFDPHPREAGDGHADQHLGGALRVSIRTRVKRVTAQSWNA